jgi:hypothetical protein
VREIETGLGRLDEKGPERPEQLVWEIETGLGRLAEIVVPSRCPARWIVMAPPGPNKKKCLLPQDPWLPILQIHPLEPMHKTDILRVLEVNN